MVMVTIWGPAGTAGATTVFSRAVGLSPAVVCGSGTGVHWRCGIPLAPADGRVHLLAAVRAGVGIDVGLEVLAELLHRGADGPGGSFAEGAERLAVNPVADAGDELDVVRPPAAGLDPPHHP